MLRDKIFSLGKMCVLGVLVAWTSSASTLSLSLDSVSLTGIAGGSVTFTGTIQNSSGAEVFLNGAGGILTYSELTLDLTPFFTFTPLSIPDGQMYSGPLFAVAISGVALSGDYPGNTFYIQGGADSSTFDTVGTVDFEVDVSTGAAVPEVSSGNLAGIGCIFITAFLAYQKRRSGTYFPG